jgi:hypothetical protein
LNVGKDQKSTVVDDPGQVAQPRPLVPALRPPLILRACSPEMGSRRIKMGELEQLRDRD